MAGEQIDKLTLWVLVKAEDEASAAMKKVDDAAKATAASIEKTFGKANEAQKALAASAKGTEANMKRLAKDSKELQDQLSAPFRSDIAKTLNAELANTAKVFQGVSHEVDPFAAALARGGGNANQLTSSLASLRAGLAQAADFTRIFNGTIRSISDETLKAVAASTNWTQLQAAYANGVLKSGESTSFLADELKGVAGAFAQQNAVTLSAEKAQREYEKRTQSAAAATRHETEEKKKAEAQGRLLNKSIADSALNQRLMAQASAEAGQALARELGGSLVTVGGHFGRLGGVTTTFAQTLGRQMVRGTGDATSGISALINRTKLIGLENKRFDETVKNNNATLNGAAAAANAEADALRNSNVAKIATQASVAKMSIGLGAATAAFALTAAGAVTLVATLKKLIRLGIEVSTAFDEVAVRMNPSISSMERFRTAIFNLSRESGVEVDKLAKTLGNVLLHSTQDSTKALNLVGVATRTSIAAFEDAERVATQLSDTLRAFGRSSDDAQAASNALLIAMRASNEEFDQIASAVSQLAPLATALGIALEDVAFAQAAVVRSGVPAQQAVFGLRLILSKLADPTSDVVKKLRLMGVRVDEATFSQKKFLGVLKDIRAATGGTSENIAKLFGESRVAGTAVALLTKGIGEMEGQVARFELGIDEAADAKDNLFQQPGKALRLALNEITVAIKEIGTAVVDVLGSSKDTIEFLRDIATWARIAAMGVNDLIGALRAYDKFVKDASGFTLLFGSAVDSVFGDDAVGSARKWRDLMDQQAASLKLVAELTNAFAAARANAAKAPPEAAAGPSLREQADLIKDQIEQILRKTQTAEALLNDLSDVAAGAGRDISVVMGSIDAFMELSAEASVHSARAAFNSANATVAAFTKINAAFQENKGGALREQLTAALGSVFKADRALERLEERLKTLGASLGRFGERARKALALAEFGAIVSGAAERGSASLARFYDLAGEQSLVFQDVLRGEIETLAKRNALLAADGSGGKSAQAALDRFALIKKAADDSKASVLAFGTESLTELGKVEQQLSRTREYIIVLKLMGFDNAAAEAAAFAASFEKDFVAPLRAGFSGGFDSGLRGFFITAGDAFKRGADAADTLAGSWTDAKAALIELDSTSRTALGNLEYQLANIRQLATEASLAALREENELTKKSFEDLAAAMNATANDYERRFVQPARDGFGGGFGQGIKDFVREAQDSFRLGQDAAAQFAGAFTGALQNMIASIGTGKTSLKSFAVAVLQSITQIIAQLIALRIAASVFSLFGGGGATVASSGGNSLFGFPSSGDTGGVRTFDRGGMANFDVGGQQDLMRGGINTRPTMFAAPLKRGMTEAFVPLPGPNRGIPVEFRNGGGQGGARVVNLNLTIVSNSIDPRTAGDVIMAHIPKIAKGIAGVIHGGSERSLNMAIRGA